MFWEGLCVFSRLKRTVEDMISGKCSVFSNIWGMLSRVGRTFLKPRWGHVFSKSHHFGECTFSSKHPILSNFPFWEGHYFIVGPQYFLTLEDTGSTCINQMKMSIMGHPNQGTIAYVLRHLKWCKGFDVVIPRNSWWFAEVKVPRWKLRWPSQALGEIWSRVEKMNVSN